MIQYIQGNTASIWGERIVEQICETCQESQRNNIRPLHLENMVNTIHTAGKRLFIFSLEGVLCRRVSLPDLIFIHEDVFAKLRSLANDPANMVVIQSPRSGETLERVLTDADNTPMNCILAAEHGLFMKWGPDSSWQCTLPSAAGIPDPSWKSEVLSVLEFFTERAPGAVVENKQLCLSWHYLDCDHMHSSWLAKEVLSQLQDLSKRLPILVSSGSRVIEIRYRPDVHVNLVEICLNRMADVLQERHSLDSSDGLVSSNGASPNFKATTPFASTEEFFLDASKVRTRSRQSTIHRVNSNSESGKFDDESIVADFVLLVANGQDPTDEDLFEYLEAEQQDLDAFLQTLGLEQDEEKEEVKGKASEQKSQEHLQEKPLKSEELRPISPLFPPNNPSPVRRRKTPRQSDISSLKKFAPRKDYPPAKILYQAMKRKYGDNFINCEFPDTPAACWALVYTMVPSMAHRHQRSGSDHSSPTPAEDLKYSVHHSLSKSGVPNIHPSILDQKIFMPPRTQHCRTSSLPLDEPDLGPGSIIFDLSKKRNTSDIGLLYKNLENSLKYGSPSDSYPSLNLDDEQETNLGPSPVATDQNLHGHKKKKIQLPKDVFSVKVGPAVSQASYFIKNIDGVHKLLGSIDASFQAKESDEQQLNDFVVDDTPVVGLILDGTDYVGVTQEELEDDRIFFEDMRKVNHIL